MAAEGEAAPLRSGAEALVRVSAALASGDGPALRAALARARSEVPAGQVEEVLLQAYLFVGFPPVLAGMAAWREILGGPPVDEADPLADPGDVAGWARRGEELCRRVYGRAYARLRRNVRGLHPALDRWMVTEGYGKVLGRPGLDPVLRELCIVALLAAAGGDPQLRSHLRGALRLGASPEEVEAALAAGLAHVPEEERRRARRALWRRVREAAGASGRAGGAG